MNAPTIEQDALDRYECANCGYVYEPTRGDSSSNVAADTPFTELPEAWRCPVCGAGKPRFSNIGPKGSPSGFKENLNYGFGFNAMPPGRKNALIFGVLALGILFFLSLYGLR